MIRTEKKAWWWRKKVRIGCFCAEIERLNNLEVKKREI